MLAERGLHSAEVERLVAAAWRDTPENLQVRSGRQNRTFGVLRCERELSAGVSLVSWAGCSDVWPTRAARWLSAPWTAGR